MDTNMPNDIRREKGQLEYLLGNAIGDGNILLYVFGTDDLEEIVEDCLSQYRQYPLYMKNVLSLTFYFSYACYRYDMDYGNMDSEKMTKHNAKRVIKSLKDAFVRYPATQELIQYVLTDIQFDLAQGNGELRYIFGDLSNRDMSRFSFNPYFKLVAGYDKNPGRFKCEDKEEMLRLMRELLETLTFLHHYELQQVSTDRFRFVSKKHASCEFEVLPLNHVFFRKPNTFGGIYHLFSVETREHSEPSGQNTRPTVVLRYFSGSNSLVFNLPDEAGEEDDASHLAGQRLPEVYMEITGWELAQKARIEQSVKSSNSIEQIHTVNYKYIKNLALAISDAISANAGSKEALYKQYSKVYPYIFQKNGAQQTVDCEDRSLDWDTVVIMLLIEASPTAVLERLMWQVPQTFYDIVNNLYNRTGLAFFKCKQAELNAEVQNIYDKKLIVGEAGGFGKITTPKPTGRLLARARAMLIISQLSMLQESDQDESLIYTGNLRSNISLLQNMGSDVENEKRIRYACIILSETLKHLMCFYSGLYAYGEMKADYDVDAYDKCLSKAVIKQAQKDLEDAFFAAAKEKAKALAGLELEADRPKDTLRLFQSFMDFCNTQKRSEQDNRCLYVAVGKYEIIDGHILNRVYAQLEAVSGDPYSHADIWVDTTLEILEYFKTGSFRDTPYDHDLLNTIYPFTAAFNRGKENPDGYKTVNFSLNIDIDSDAAPEYQSDINVLSEFSYARSEVYYCLPNVIRSNYKWWIDPVLVNFRKFNDIFADTRKEDR